MDWKPLLQNKWLLVLGGLGVLFILFGTFWNGSGKTLATLAKPSGTAPSGGSGGTSSFQTSGAGNATTQLQDSYDQQLTNMLTQLQGIQQVSVMITLDSSGSVQVANNQETTTQTQRTGNQTVSNSTTQNTQVFTQRNADGSQVPYVIQQTVPTVRGVFVTVSANDFYVAKAEIINAIQHVLDVPAYKISVEPKKNNS